VFVSKISEADGHESVAFTYHQISLTTTAQNTDGSPGASTTVSYDLDLNREGAGIPDPVVPATTPSGGAAHSYYLLIDGIAGAAPERCQRPPHRLGGAEGAVERRPHGLRPRAWRCVRHPGGRHHRRPRPAGVHLRPGSPHHHPGKPRRQLGNTKYGELGSRGE